MYNSMDIQLIKERRYEAIGLIAHHLEVAAALFESVPEEGWEDILKLVAAKGLNKQTQVATEAFISELESYHRALDQKFD